MKDIQLRDIKKSFKGEVILEGLNLTIKGGTFFVLLGPSGCGKTTLLRLIAGFETVDSGTIMLGDKDITHMPINERSVNTVFQNYALFPHLNVYDNIAYGLRVKRMTPEIIEHKVRKILKTVRLERHIYKSVQQLSGGQQQRIALARAIVNEPDVLLLDEPLAALDFTLREQMLVELIELQDTLRTTFIYVTHDQVEALTVADKIAIFNHDGEIEQIATPKEIYEFPSSRFVAEFVGKTNILRGVVGKNGDDTVLQVEGLGAFRIDASRRRELIPADREVFLSIRPEKIQISKRRQENFSNNLEGTVQAIVYHGRSTQYTVRLKNDKLLYVFEQNDEHFPKEQIDYDDVVHVCWQKENAVLLEK